MIIFVSRRCDRYGHKAPSTDYNA